MEIDTKNMTGNDFSECEQIYLQPHHKNNTIPGKIKVNHRWHHTTIQHSPNQFVQKTKQQIIQSNNTEPKQCSLHSIRKITHKICSSKQFQVCLLISYFVFLVSCVCQDQKRNVTLTYVAQIIQLACLVSFLFYFICRLVKWEDQDKRWLVLDFVTMITGIVAFCIYPNQACRYLKAVRTLRLIFIIKEVQILNFSARAILKSIMSAGKILVPALVIIYVYAVVGLYVFSDFQFNKCRDKINLQKTQNWTVYQDDVYLCGQRECPVYQGQQLQCLNPIDYEVEPNQQQLRNMIQGNGVMKYSNIFFALLSTFKQTFVTGSSRLIVLYKQALNPAFVSYIYLNIFYSQIIIYQEKGKQDRQKRKIDQKNKELPVKNQKGIFQQKKRNKIVKSVSFDDSERQNIKNLNCFKIKKQFHGKQIQIQQMIIQHNLEKKQIIEEQNNQQTNQLQNSIDNSQLFNRNHSLSGLQSNEDKDQRKRQNQETTSEYMSKCESTLTQKEQQIKVSLSIQCPKNYFKYEVVNNILILLCCINLSLDFHQQSEQFKFIVDCIDFAFYCLFIIQISIKVLVQRYILQNLEFATKLQILICCICTVGVIYQASIAISLIDFFSSTNSTSGIFRSFKYLRLMILILRSNIFKQARLIFQWTFKSLYSIRYIAVIWFIIVLTFSIIGFHLHSYKTKVNESTGQLDLVNGIGFQISYDGIFQSILFTLLTFYNQQWDYIMFQQYLGGGALLVIWQLISIVVGLLILSKYFIMKIVEKLSYSFENTKFQDDQLIMSEKQKEDQKKKQKQKKSLSNPNKIIPVGHLISSNNPVPTQEIQMINRLVRRKETTKTANKQKLTQNLQNSKAKNCQYFVDRLIQFLRNVIMNKYYKIIFGFFIISSCITLINTHPHVDPNSSTTQIYKNIDLVNKIFFLCDLFINLTVFGVFQQESSYLRRSWLSCLNILIIVIQTICLTNVFKIHLLTKIQKIKVFRTLYFGKFRYRQDWNMKITCRSFLQLLPKVMTLLLITLIFYSYFALILVKLYKDDFYVCQNLYIQIDAKDMQECMLWGGDWVQQSINVSNIVNSTLYLFYVATMQGWISLLYPMMNLAGKNNNPVRDANKYISIFFMFFFFFGNFVMLNVFIGLSISNLKRLKDKITGQAHLTKQQKQWLNVKTQIYGLSPIILHTKPSNCVRGLAFQIANYKYYKAIQGIFFFAFLTAMSFYQSNMTDYTKSALKYIHHFFIGILTLQYFIQLLAFGVRKQYLKSFAFKSIVVVYAIIFIIVQQLVYMTKYQNRIFGGIFIALQLIRYLALLDQIPFAKKLLNLILSILPRTSNILLFICITLFIYAIFGMELFAFLRPNIQLDEFNQNYTNFGSALFALIKFSTLESPIQQISDAAQTISPDFLCTQINNYSDFLVMGQNGCGNAYYSYFFFLSFHIFYGMLLMSTIIAIIVDSYTQVKRQEQGNITKYVLDKVRNQWSIIDPQATGYIPYRQFWLFTAKLLQIYEGNEDKKSHADISTLFSNKQDLLSQMNIPIYENQNGVLCFQFHEVIQSLTRIYLLKQNQDPTFTKKAEKMFNQRQSLAVNGFKKSYYTSSHVATLIILKSGLRLWKKIATNQSNAMKYQNAFQNFNKGKQKTTYNNTKKEEVQE